ncbi:MAG: hypothetical protein ACRBCT_06215 [Alphaproteobacteria bacterium]
MTATGREINKNIDPDSLVGETVVFNPESDVMEEIAVAPTRRHSDYKGFNKKDPLTVTYAVATTHPEPGITLFVQRFGDERMTYGSSDFFLLQNEPS